MLNYPELAALYRCANRAKALGIVREQGRVRYDGRDFPLLSFHFGNEDLSTPALVFVAGVHGLEKIGTQIVTSYLESWIHLLSWDKTLQALMQECRVIFYPLVNPVGMYLNRRSNAMGVDLMRNAPIEAEGSTVPFVSGHRISPRLPWYRGNGVLEFEAQTLYNFIQEICFSASASLVLDVHSGFGLRDRIWFPFASSSRYFPDAPSVMAIKSLIDRTYPHHNYTIEPQHHSYITHGDLWDLLYLEFEAKKLAGKFLPLCLEMGSWSWVKKNPRQIFSSFGLFNPVLPHRIKRAERRHFLLFNFLVKVLASPESWAVLSSRPFDSFKRQALRQWYSHI